MSNAEVDVLVSTRSRTMSAMAVSSGVHALLFGLLVVLPLPTSSSISIRSPISAPMRWQQLEGRSASNAGSNALAEILSAPDAVRIAVTPVVPTGGVQGLAWWSPSHGLWFALDGAPSQAAGTEAVLWLRLPDQQIISPGIVYIHGDGSGRIVSRGNVSPSTPRRGVITLELSVAGVTLSGRIDAGRLRSS